MLYEVITRVLEGLGVRHIYEVDTYQQAKLTEMVKDAVNINEFRITSYNVCYTKLLRIFKGPDVFPLLGLADQGVFNFFDGR